MRVATTRTRAARAMEMLTRVVGDEETSWRKRSQQQVTTMDAKGNRDDDDVMDELPPLDTREWGRWMARRNGVNAALVRGGEGMAGRCLSNLGCLRCPSWSMARARISRTSHTTQGSSTRRRGERVPIGR